MHSQGILDKKQKMTIPTRKSTNRQGILFLGTGVITGFIGVMILFKDLIMAGTPEVLWADNFDSRLVYWIVNWGYHVLAELKQPLGFWNANSFYPHDLTLAYSESLLGMQLLFTPLRLLGITPLISLYLTLAGVCMIGAALTQYALYRIGCFSLIESILITFCAHFSLSVISFFVHYQLFGFQLAPPFFLFIYLYLREFKQGDLLMLVSLFAIGITLAMYLAPMLFVLCILMCTPIILKQIQCVGIVKLIKNIGIQAVGIVIVAMLALYFVQLRPYLRVANAFPKHPFDETAYYSANLSSLFTGFSIFSHWYDPGGYDYGAWEYAYFPGFVLLILAGLYFIWTAGRFAKDRLSARSEDSRMERLRQQGDDRRIPGDFILYLMLLFLSALVLSWGPYYKPDPSIRLPFYYLSNFVFGLRDIRAPGRFGMFIPLPLAVFTVAFLRNVITANRAQNWAILLVTLLVVIESFPTFPVFPFSIDGEGVYKQVCQVIKPGTPVLELPVFGKDLESIQIVGEQLDGSTIHWGRLISGYGANTTSEYRALLDIDRRIQQELTAPRAAIKFGRRYGIHFYLIHLNRYSPMVAQKWKTTADEIKGRVLFETSGTLFLKLENEPAEITVDTRHDPCPLE